MSSVCVCYVYVYVYVYGYVRVHVYVYGVCNFLTRGALKSSITRRAQTTERAC